MNGSVIRLRVDAEQKRRLDELAAKTGRSGSYYVRQALEAHLDELEYVQTLEAEAGAVRRGEVKTLSLDELEAECSLGN